MHRDHLRIGHIRYINTLPLFWRLLKYPQENLELISDVPSVVNRRFWSGDIDVAMISTMSWIENGANDQNLLPEFCLKNHGGVLSVLLISKLPWSLLDGKHIGLTQSSETSVFILKTLLQHYEGFSNSYEYIAADHLNALSDCDAVLLIGDPAINAARLPHLHYYDLGEIWLSKTGHPIVFAVSVRRQNLEEELLARVILEFKASLRQFRENPRGVFDLARTYVSRTDFDLERYFRRLDYTWDKETQSSIQFMKLLYQNSLHLKN